jgi:hypothetical protein
MSMPLCKHVQVETGIDASGAARTILKQIDPNGNHTCEVCRMLGTWDELLACCKGALQYRTAFWWSPKLAGRMEAVITKATGPPPKDDIPKQVLDYIRNRWIERFEQYLEEHWEEVEELLKKTIREKS